MDRRELGGQERGGGRVTERETGYVSSLHASNFEVSLYLNRTSLCQMKGKGPREKQRGRSSCQCLVTSIGSKQSSSQYTFEQHVDPI